MSKRLAPFKPMDWSPSVAAVSPPFPFILEVTGDSDDTRVHIVTIIPGSGTPYSHINVAARDDVGDGNGDDACSCSHESWYSRGNNKIRLRKKEKDDDCEGDNDGTEDGTGNCCDYRFTHKIGIPKGILGSTHADQEALESNFEAVKDEDDMRRMEDKLFWETCLAVGYP